MKQTSQEKGANDLNESCLKRLFLLMFTDHIKPANILKLPIYISLFLQASLAELKSKFNFPNRENNCNLRHEVRVTAFCFTMPSS